MVTSADFSAVTSNEIRCAPKFCELMFKPVTCREPTVFWASIGRYRVLRESNAGSERALRVCVRSAKTGAWPPVITGAAEPRGTHLKNSAGDEICVTDR